MQFPELQYNFKYLQTAIDSKISIAYTDNGDTSNKKILLFIHGLSSYIPAWSKVIPLLEDHFRCIAIDLPGYGKSSAGVHSGNLSFYAESISKFIHTLNLSKVTLVGHSMGGQISIATALNYSDQIDKLILLAPAGFEQFTSEGKIWIKKNFSPEIIKLTSDKHIRSSFSSNFYLMPKDVEPMIEDRIKMKRWKNFSDYCKVVSNSLTGLLDYPVFDQLNKIVQRTLIIFGKNDKFIPQPLLHKDFNTEMIASKGASLIRNSKLVLINECGHFLQFEKPEPVSKEIIEFMC